MRIFIAWSGERSRVASLAIAEFLRSITPVFRAWVSDNDIGSGTDWRIYLARALKSSRIGILCLTRATFTNPWIAYEAGALSVRQSHRICPYLLDADIVLTDSPISCFQFRRATKQGTLRLVSDINSYSATRLPAADLSLKFESEWPKLEAALSDIPQEPIRKKFNRLDRKGLDALLQIHFQASVDRLTHAVEDGITHLKTARVEHVLTRIEREITEGRTMLSPFTTDMTGPVDKYLNSKLTLDQLAATVRDVAPVFVATRRAADRHKLIIDLVVREQALLRARLEALYSKDED